MIGQGLPLFVVPAATGFIAAAASWILVPAMMRHAQRKGIVCTPNARSSHELPIPRGCGLAFVITTLAAWTAIAAADGTTWIAVVAVSSACVAAVGFADDCRGLPARIRLTVHLVAAMAVAWSALHGSPAVGAVGALAIAWSTNLFNFMDGIDGLAASEGAFCAAAGAVVVATTGGEPALVCGLAAMAGAIMGFLPWNAPKARAFMGDAGSTWIGFSLAALGIIHAAQHPEAIPALLILPAVFVSDASVCLARRMARGERPSQAHRAHAYQNMSRRLGSHAAVTAICATFNLLLAGAAAAAVVNPSAAWLITACCYAAVISAVAAAKSGVHGVSA